MFFKNFFKSRKNKKREKYADIQLLDAIDLIKDVANTYLDLLTEARQDPNDKGEDIIRLEAKLNNNFEYLNISWDGQVKVTHSFSSTCNVIYPKKRLQIK